MLSEGKLIRSVWNARLYAVLACPGQLWFFHVLMLFLLSQAQTASMWIWSWRSWQRPVQEKSLPLHLLPPRRPHPPQPPPHPHRSALQDWRYRHTLRVPFSSPKLSLCFVCFCFFPPTLGTTKGSVQSIRPDWPRLSACWPFVLVCQLNLHGGP